jgi:hypothetical protein
VYHSTARILTGRINKLNVNYLLALFLKDRPCLLAPLKREKFKHGQVSQVD